MSGTFHTKYSIDSIRISGDHKYVLCAQSKLNGAIWGGRIDVLDISMKRTAAAEAESGISSVDWMDQSTFAAGTDDGTVEIYRFNPDEIKLKLTTTLDQHDRIVSSVAAKQENVLSASHDGLIHLWSISSSTPSCVKATFRQHHDVVQDVCWFDQEESFVSVGRDGQGLIWDTRTQSKSSFMNDNSDGILCAKVCNNFIAVGMESGRVEIRDRRSTKIPIYADVSSHRLPVSSVLIIMREETLLVASASDDTSVRVRTMNEKDEKKIDFTYKGHNDYVRALEFGPPGCVFSGGRDQLLHCWTYLLPVAVTK